MEKLSMCRICLSNDIGLRSIVNTHLQEMYELLTKIPFVTEDSTPIWACGFCCAKLDNTYELRRRCLRSEELFTQLLRSNVQVNLQIMPAMLLSVEDVHPMIPNAFDSDEVKEAPEDARDDSRASADSEDDTGTCSMIKTELDVDNVVPNFEEDPLEGDDNIQSSASEDTISLAVVKEEQRDVTAITVKVNAPGRGGCAPDDSDVADSDEGKQEDAEDARDDSSASADSEDDTGTCSMIKTEPKVEYVVRINFEEDQLKEDDDSIQYSDSEDIISLAFVKNEQNDVTANARDDSSASADSEDVIGTCSMIKTELDVDNVVPNFEEDQLKEDDECIQYSDSEDTISLAVVKNEQSDVTASVPGKPRLDAQKNCEDKPSKYLKRSDQSKNKIEEPTSNTKEAVEDKSVKKNKRVETCDKLDMKLHNNKQNNSTSHPNDVHKEISANNIRAHKSVNSNSSNKLKQFVCDTCQKCFRYKCFLIGHIRTHTGEKPYQCNVCKKSFSDKYGLNKHILTHTGEKPYQCNVCNKSFRQKCHLDGHIRTHTGEKPYQCNVCKKCFSEKSCLNKHIRTHTGEKPYQCNICKKGFSRKGHLDCHIRIHTGEKPYQCNECTKCFSRKRCLDIHTRIHTGEKPYQCNVCKKGFYQKGNLDCHILIHTGEKPYQCNVCKKGFYRKNTLDYHIRIHTGEKPYQCNVCKKGFYRKGHLDCHTRIHTGEKPYQCNECKKFFSTKRCLDIHTRIHTGEKPYQCNVCKKGFCQKGHLDSHIRIHTGEKPYQCNECKKCFRGKSNLIKHISLQNH